MRQSRPEDLRPHGECGRWVLTAQERVLTAQERNERTDGSARRENSCSSAAPSFSISDEKSCAQYLLPEKSSRITSTSVPSRAGGANGLRRMRESARASVKSIELSWVGNELSRNLGDDNRLRAAYRGGCRACQNLPKGAIRHVERYHGHPVPSA